MESNTVFSVLEIVATVIVSLMLLRFISGRMQLKAVKRITAKFASENQISIASNANFFGQKSKGRAQIRGNGVWLLTPNRIYFEMFLPKRIYEIPLDTLINAKIEKSFLGKAVVAVPLLVIEFINESGATDEMAWALSDAQNRAKLIIQTKTER